MNKNELKTYWSHELFDSRGNILSAKNFSKSKFFSIFINDDLFATYDYPVKLGSAEKQKLLKKYSRIELKKFKEISKKEISKKEIEEIDKLFREILAREKEEQRQRDLEKNKSKRKAERERKKLEREKELEERIDLSDCTDEKYFQADNILNSIYIGPKRRFIAKTTIEIPFDMKERENEFLILINNRIDEAISKFRILFPDKKITNFYTNFALTKFNDLDYNQTISTGFTAGTITAIKNSSQQHIIDFNIRKKIDPIYGEIRLDVMSVKEMTINILWDLLS